MGKAVARRRIEDKTPAELKSMTIVELIERFHATDAAYERAAGDDRNGSGPIYSRFTEARDALAWALHKRAKNRAIHRGQIYEFSHGICGSVGVETYDVPREASEIDAEGRG